MRIRLIFLTFLILFSLKAFTQNDSIVQFTGTVFNDSLERLPFVNIILLNQKQGTISNFNGYFSFATIKGDTIVFSSVGYKHKLFIISDSSDELFIYSNIIMERDTIRLQEVNVYPWPTFEQFKYAFLHTKIPDDNIEIAKKNMELIKAQDLAADEFSDASLSYNNYMNYQNHKLYYRGQYPPNNLLNPLAWAAFVKAIRDGDFSNKKK